MPNAADPAPHAAVSTARSVRFGPSLLNGLLVKSEYLLQSIVTYPLPAQSAR